MNEDIRDALAEEQGYTICPFSLYTYVVCNLDCDHCDENPYSMGSANEVENGNIQG